MRARNMYILAVSAYLLFLCGLIATIKLIEDETTRIMSMSFLSTGLLTFTVLFSLLVSRKSSSERYRELYMSGEDGDPKQGGQ